ncbi:hypothetical protein L0990_12615 [Vibrio kanaloae]|uniref:hypothetical protein n=1 Tax=Vibrio kanaloae TaxID=170673 RepID=UPI0035A639F9
MSDWLRTDERQEFISSMQMVCRSLNECLEDEVQWKWGVIALHSAIQGIMVMSLRGTNDFLIMPEKLAGKCIKAHSEEKSWPKVKMDSFPSLYQKVQSEEMMCFYVDSKALTKDSDRDKDLNYLSQLRNSFIHFMPQGFSLYVADLPNVFLSLLKMIKFLGWETTNVTWYDEKTSEKAKLLVDDAISITNTLKNQQGI